VLYCYASARRSVLHGLLRHAGTDLAMPGPIIVHGAMTGLNRAYARPGWNWRRR
jgi:putative mRNA 3-end processing factor